MKKHGLCASENRTPREKDIILLQRAAGGAERVKAARAIWGAQDVFKKRQGLHCHSFPLFVKTIIDLYLTEVVLFASVDEQLNNSKRQLKFNTSL